MAKGKKAARALTPEEKLKQALVPVEEQPYRVPENWCWVYLLDSFENHTDSKKKVPRKTYLEDGELAVVDQGQELVGGYTDDEDMAYLGKLPVIIFGDHTRCIKYIDFPFAQGADGIKVLLPKSFYVPRAFYYALQSINIPDMGYRRHYPLFSQYSIPLPPLIEQQRIVDRIESLYAKLDEAKEKVQAVVDGFELRKSAILHKAFTGELTRQWRKENGVGLDSWETKRIKEVAKPRAGYAFDSTKFTNIGYQIIRMGNLYGGELDLSRNPVFISQSDVDENILKKALIDNGDILISLTGTKYKRDYGYAVCVINPVNLLVNQRILCLTPSVDVERNFILYYLRSNVFRDIFFSNETGGVNQGNVSSKFVENIEIKMPSLMEQHEIVIILDRLMAKEQQAKEAAESVLAQIGIIKKAILARAFRGELGTNDPGEESAKELVKKVLSE